MNQDKIELLENQFMGIGDVKGFSFRKLAETAKRYLYEVKKYGSIHFEVIDRIKVPLCLDFANRIYSETDFKETYPKSSLFGTHGWNYHTQESAIKKLNEDESR